MAKLSLDERMNWGMLWIRVKVSVTQSFLISRRLEDRVSVQRGSGPSSGQFSTTSDKRLAN